jgi:hypothetical protein
MNTAPNRCGESDSSGWCWLRRYYIRPRFIQVILDALEEHGVHGDDDRGDRHKKRRPLGLSMMP